MFSFVANLGRMGFAGSPCRLSSSVARLDRLETLIGSPAALECGVAEKGTPLPPYEILENEATKSLKNKDKFKNKANFYRPQSAF